MKRSTAITLIIIALLLVGATPSRIARADDCLTPDSIGCMYGLPTFQYQLVLAEMLAHPNPNVRPLEVDENEVNKFSFYRVKRDSVTFFDAPNGSAVGTLDAGFNYLAIRKRDGDWAEVFPGKWIPLAMLTNTRASEFAGVLIDQPLTHPMAWVLKPVRPSAVPGVVATKDTPTIARYTRVSIFATVKVGDWEWYLVAPGQWLEQRDVARALPTQKPEGVKGRWYAIDLFEQVLIAYDEDQMVFATLVATGLPKWSTNEGTFRIWTRTKSDSMSGAMGEPDFYYLQSVPYVMYFDHAISIHGTYWHDGFGYRHSHGCVNVSISDARWLYQWSDNFYADTWVHVWSSGEYK